MAFIKLDDPAALPTDDGFGVAFSHDSTYLAIAHWTSPYVTIYKRSGDTFTKLANPAALPTGNGRGAAFSHDSTYLAVAHSTSPYITIYKRSGDTFTKLDNPAALPTDIGFGVAFSHDSTYLAIAHYDSPYVTIYKRSGDTFTKLDNPAVLPTGAGHGVAFSHDSTYLAIAHYDSPYVTIYKRSGDTFTKLDNPAALPTGDGRGAAFSHDSTYLAVAHSTSPYITIYKRSGDTFTKLDNPAALPTGDGYGVAFSHDSTYLAIAHWTSPYVTIYLTTQPPGPPSALSPNGVYFPAGESYQFTWQHNPVDGKAQTHYEIQYRVQGAGTWTSTGQIASGTSSHTFAAATFTDGNEYEWQVRTWSEGNETAGDWSASAVFTCYSRPTVTITVPDSDSYVHTSGTITAQWDFSQAQGNGQAAYRLKLYSSNNGIRGVLLWDSGEVASSAELCAINYILTQNREYQIGLMVKSDADLWSAAEVFRIFATSFIAPTQPLITLTADNDNAAITITVANPEPEEGEPEVTHNDIYRREPGGEWIRIIQAVEPDGEAVDYTPGHNVVYEYKAVAHGVNYGTSESEPASVSVNFAGWVILTPLDAPAEQIKVRYNISRDLAIEPEVVLHHFAGRTKPVSFTGEATTKQLNLQFAFNAWDAAGHALLNNFEAMAERGTTVLYRTGHLHERNRRMFGVITQPSINEADTSIWTVSLTFTETDHREEV